MAGQPGQPDHRERGSVALQDLARGQGSGAGLHPLEGEVMMTFNPALAVKVAADDVGSLRRIDVFRVLDWTPPAHRQAVADYLIRERPDLAGEVAEALADC